MIDVTDAEAYAGGGCTKEPVHWSRLKLMALSPMHYLHAVVTGRSLFETTQMRVGTAAHKIVLGGEKGLVVYEGVRRGAAWKVFEKEHEKDTIVSRQEMEQAMWIGAAVLSNDLATSYLGGAETEVEKAFTFMGRACESRLDVVHPRWIADFKTTSCAEPKKFGRHALNLCYHAQLAFYLRAAGRDPDNHDAFIIAVESRAPYPIVVMRVTPECLIVGDALNRKWMEQLLECEKSGNWPGYTSDVVDLDVPEWEQETTLLIDGESVTL